MSNNAQIAPQGAQAALATLRASSITETPEQQLDMLRRAWRQRLSAEATLERLRRYTRHTAGMKDDSRRASTMLREADQVFVRLLG